jgi:hypothetical protein
MKRILIIFAGFVAILAGVYFFIVRPASAVIQTDDPATDNPEIMPGVSDGLPLTGIATDIANGTMLASKKVDVSYAQYEVIPPMTIMPASTVNHAIVGEIPLAPATPYIGETVAPAENAALQTQSVITQLKSAGYSQSQAEVIATASPTTPVAVTKSVVEMLKVNPVPVPPRTTCNATDPTVLQQWQAYNDVWTLYQTGENRYHIACYGAVTIPPGWAGGLNKDIYGATFTAPQGFTYQYGDFWRV